MSSASGNTMLTGGCSCGVVRYRIDGAPLAAYLCHCTDCQRRTGSAFAMALLVSARDFSIEEGKPRKVKKIRPSGRVSINCHCPTCLVRIYTISEGSEILSLRPGTLDRPTAIEPVAQLWTRSAHPWALVDGILSYEGNPENFADIVHAWRERNAHPIGS